MCFHLRNIGLALLIVTTGACGGGRAQATDPRPNIVVIVADDLGWNDVGYHGGRMATPHIDRLCAEGVELDRFYVAPMCSPTRAGLMTGRYPIRFGMARAVVPPWRRYGLDPEETTLAEMLGAAGYKHRGAIGKWHLGHLEARWHPLAQGFTYFQGHYNGAIDYFTLQRDGQRDWHTNYTPTDAHGYATDLITSAAIQFIEDNAQELPFFCYVSYNAPHEPLQAPASELAKHANLSGDNQVMAAMISRMDGGIGRILDTLHSTGIDSNTVVIFLSDNGGTRRFADSNAPLRGYKLDVYEGGVRVPACVRWPGRIKAGRKMEDVVSYLDIFPTLMHIAGLHEHAGKPIDGSSILAALKDGSAVGDRELYFYQGQDGPQRERIAVISNGMKLVIVGPQVNNGVDEKHTITLFDIDADPYEKNDIATQQPNVVTALSAKLVAFRALQPSDAIAAMYEGRDGFRPPANWEIKAPR